MPNLPDPPATLPIAPAAPAQPPAFGRWWRCALCVVGVCPHGPHDNGAPLAETVINGTCICRECARDQPTLVAARDAGLMGGRRA